MTIDILHLYLDHTMGRPSAGNQSAKPFDIQHCPSSRQGQEKGKEKEKEREEKKTAKGLDHTLSSPLFKFLTWMKIIRSIINHRPSMAPDGWMNE